MRLVFFLGVCKAPVFVSVTVIGFMEATLINVVSTTRHRVLAGGMALAIALAVVLLLPHATTPTLVVTPFLPIFATWVTLTEGLTAFLLWTQYKISGRLFLAALAGAYAFVSVTSVIQLLVFPGVFSPSGLLGAGPQSGVWIWVFWHAGFPILVMGALAVRTTSHAALDALSAQRWSGTAIVTSAILLSAAFCVIAVYDGGALLPVLISGKSYAQLSGNPIAILVEALCFTALGLHVSTTRLRTTMDLWVTIALLASVADVVLTLSAGARYSIGWYAARAASMISASTVLGMLVYETSGLYRDLNAAHLALKESSSRDGLTKIFNRAYFDKRLPRELSNVAVANQTLSLLLIDVDHFKHYNDTFGHQVGDKCLQYIAETLETGLRRKSDFVARYGGEEFVVVLPYCDGKSALSIADSLRKVIAGLRLWGPSDEIPPLTISIGCATSNLRIREDAATLLTRADAALYRAKASGRNKVVEADPPSALVRAMSGEHRPQGSA